MGGAGDVPGLSDRRAVGRTVLDHERQLREVRKSLETRHRLANSEKARLEREIAELKGDRGDGVRQ